MEACEDASKEPPVSLIECKQEQGLRLRFFLWLLALKVISAALSTWPFLLHTASLLPAPEDLMIDLTWEAVAKDPLSWLCFTGVTIAWLAWTLSVGGLVRGNASMISVGRMVWSILVLITLAVSSALWVLKRTYRPYRHRAEINPAIMSVDNEKWFVVLFVVPLVLCVAGSILVGCLRKLEVIFKAEEIVRRRQALNQEVSAEELLTLV